MRKKNLFFGYQNEATGRQIIVEESKKEIWVYLILPNATTIEKSCFLASRVEITKDEIDMKFLAGKGVPPQMFKVFSTEKTCIPDLAEDDISINWTENGAILIEIRNQPFLFFLKNEKKGFCKSVGKNGMYGNAWDEEKFAEHFLIITRKSKFNILN